MFQLQDLFKASSKIYPGFIITGIIASFTSPDIKSIFQPFDMGKKLGFDWSSFEFQA